MSHTLSGVGSRDMPPYLNEVRFQQLGSSPVRSGLKAAQLAQLIALISSFLIKRLNAVQLEHWRGVGFIFGYPSCLVS